MVSQGLFFCVVSGTEENKKGTVSMVPWMSMDVGFGQSNIGELKSCERMSLRRCIGLNLGAWLEVARFW